MFKLLLNSQNCRFFLWLSFLKPIKSCLRIIWIPKRNDPVCFWRRIETVLYYLQVLLRGWQGWTWMHGNWMNWVKWGQALEWFSFECRKTKTKVITLANHIGHRQYIEPIKTRSNYMWLTQSAGKCMRARHNWLWFYFWLDEKVARIF